MRIVGLIALLIVLTCNVGCLSPLAIGTIGGAGSNAAFSNSGRGKAESFVIAKYDDVIAATLRAVEALSLEVKEKRIENGQAFYRCYDAKQKRIDLFIEYRSDTMTSVIINVGWFGSVAFGRLMARRILFELNESKDFLENWTHIEQN